MIPEHQLVQQIRELIRTDDLRNRHELADMAEQFSHCCAEANDRLLLCSEYLAAGRRTEAVNEAQSSPPLLPLVDHLVFPELSRWRSICANLELPPAPPLHTELVDTIRRELSREEQLSPLLTRFRRLMHDGDRDGSIDVLRLLRREDPESPVWEENLRPLEKERLPRTVDRVRQALVRGDTDALRRLHTELTHPQRAVPVPEGVLSQVEGALENERQQNLAAEAGEILQRLALARDGENETAAGEELSVWDDLTGSRGYVPTSHQRDRVDEVRSWLESGEQSRRAQERVDTARATLEKVLVAELTGTAPLHEARERFLATGGEETVDLTRRIEGRCADIEREQARRRRRRRLFTTLAALGLLCVAAIVWRVRERARRVRSVVGEITSLLQAEDFGEIEEVLAGLEHSAPALLETREFQGLLSRIETAYGQFTDQEEEARRRERELRLLEEQLNQILHRIEGARQRRDAGGFASLQEERSQAEQALALGESGLAMLADAPPAIAERVRTAVAELQAWKAELDRRETETVRRAAELQERLRELRTAPLDLESYLALVRDTLEQLPDMPFRDGYQRVLDTADQLRQAGLPAGLRLTDLPPQGNSAEALSDLRTQAAGTWEDGVWGPDLQKAFAYLEGCEATGRELLALPTANDRILGFQVVHYSRLGATAPPSPLYSRKPLRSREQKSETGATYTLYWGEVFRVRGDDPVPWLTHTSEMFPEGLNTRDYRIDVRRSAQENMVEQDRFVLRFVTDALEKPQLDIHLLEGLQTLLADRRMEPIPRAWLIKQLVQILNTAFPGHIDEAQTMQELCREMDTDLPWMNSAHPKVMAAGNRIQELCHRFPKIAPIRDRLIQRRQILAAALGRSVRWVGTVQPNADGTLELVTTPGPWKELWVLQPSGRGARHCFVLAALRSGERLVRRERVRNELYPGQLLYGPCDGRTTDDLRESLGGVPDTELPFAWPRP